MIIFFILHAIIVYKKSRKLKLFFTFVDFSKTFDTVRRAGLWSKQIKYNIHGKIYSVINNMHAHIKSYVHFNGEKSTFFTSVITGFTKEKIFTGFIFAVLKCLGTLFISKRFCWLAILWQWFKIIFKNYCSALCWRHCVIRRNSWISATTINP